MKYYILKEILDYLQKNINSIKIIKRADNNLIAIEFNQKNILYFDMSKGNSKIYKKEGFIHTKREYNAPFDVVLLKRFSNCKITNISLVNDDKVLRFDVLGQSSYKASKSAIQFEFTGKYTNCIILDEHEVVLEALRHIDEFSSSRIVKVGHTLKAVPKPNFEFKKESIPDIEAYLHEVYILQEQQELQNLKNQKCNQLHKQLKKIQTLLKSLTSQACLNEESQKLYDKANLILSHLYAIKPYDKSIVVNDFNNQEVVIELDSNYPNPSSYANNLFNRAKKAKQRAKFIYLERDNLEQKQAFLERMIGQIKHAKNSDEIEFLLPKKQKNQTKTKKQEPCEEFFYKGYKILLGKSERENIHLLKNSKASDFWFHLKDTPSCHVIVQNSKKTIPPEVIEKASLLCVQFSVDFEGNYLVDYTQRRNVKVQSGANVLYNPYQTISIEYTKVSN